MADPVLLGVKTWGGGVTKNVYLIIVLSTLLIIAFTTSAAAGWIIFHKQEFRGKVIDAETKEPIEGAVVVATYQKYPIISGPGGGSPSIVKIKETLTDKKGEFYFPAYTTIIQPLAREVETVFIIFKPGYGSHPWRQVPPLVSHEEFFSKELGTKGEKHLRSKTISFTYGVLELPRRKTREERLKAIPGGPGGARSKELPLLYKAINEERRRFGLGEVR